MKSNIAIAGLGWLGLPLANHLSNLGFKIKGSVSSLEKTETLRKRGFDAYPLLISEGGLKGEIKALFSGVDLLILMIPPGLRRNTGSDYVLKMVQVLETIEAYNIKKLIFISSTSVYGDDQGKVNEKYVPAPETEAGRQLLQVEQLFFNASFLSTTIVRFGGLFGGSRQPVRYLSGRTGLSNGNAPVNLIHRTDCIGIITEIIKKEAFGHIFNAVHPSHPSKKDYYASKSNELGLDPPQYNNSLEGESYKEVDSVNLEAILGYQFKESL